MNTFKLSIGEEYEGEIYAYYFSHPSKTQKEFDADTKFLLVKYGNEYLDSLSKEDISCAEGWIMHIVDKFGELGYERLLYKQSDFSCGEIGLYDDFKNHIGEELFKKAVEHNVNCNFIWNEKE